MLIGRLLGMPRAQARARARELLERVRPRPTPPTGPPRRTRAACGAGSTWPPAWSASPAAVPGRADHRARPARPARAVGPDPAPGRGRHHGAAHHAVPGRGRRARRRPRGDRPRQGDRRPARRTSSRPRSARSPGRAPGRRAAERRGGRWRWSPSWRDRTRRSTGSWSPRRSTDPAVLPAVVRRLDDAGVVLDELALRSSSLNEVFLTLTGHRAETRRDRRAGRECGMTAISRPHPGAAQLTAAGLPDRRPAADVCTLAWRTLSRSGTTRGSCGDFSIQPIMFVLLFTYVFGGAIAGPPARRTCSSRCPGILVMNMLFVTLYVGQGLNTDLTKGVFDRLRSLPIARWAPLAGRILGRPGQAGLVHPAGAGGRAGPRVPARRPRAGAAGEPRCCCSRSRWRSPGCRC